jgi:uncharacterized protein (DUF58 family)
MRAKEGALSHFDEALNAMLLLAHVALRQGDAVGCLSFGHDTRSLLPGKGSATLNVLMERVFDLQPGFNAPDYRKAATDLAKLTDKRSLVLILTNLRDEDGEELMAAVNVAQHTWFGGESARVSGRRPCALPAGGVMRLRRRRRAPLFRRPQPAFDRRKRRGAHVLDVEPAIAGRAGNRYLKSRAAGRCRRLASRQI